MFPDRYGLPLSTYSPTAAEAFIDGVDRILALQVDAELSFEHALRYDPDFALAHAALALRRSSLGDPAGQRASLERALALAPDLSEREQSFIEAIDAGLNAGATPNGAARALAVSFAHVGDYPRDCLLVQQTLALLARSGFADRKQRALVLCERLAPHYDADWAFDAAYAMALQEQDRLDEARALGERSLAANRGNALAAHPIAHVYYETNAHTAGAVFLVGWLANYAGSYYCHLTWHLALHELALGHYGRTRDLLEHDIAPRESARTLLPDAASLLWRLRLYDGDAATPAALNGIAATAAGKPAQAFEAAHAALWAAATADEPLFDRLVDGLRALADGANALASTVTLPLVLGVRAFAAGAYDDAIAHLEPLQLDQPVTGTAVALGGSNAQREVFLDTLLQAYLRAKRFDAAEALLRRRLQRRDGARDRFWLGEAQSGLGRASDAVADFDAALALWPDAEATAPEQQALRAARVAATA